MKTAEEIAKQYSYSEMQEEALYQELRKWQSSLQSQSPCPAFLGWETEGIPVCWKIGDWDGKMSDLCLCQDSKGEYHLARCYSYEREISEWYDKDDFGLRHDVVKWILLEHLQSSLTNPVTNKTEEK